MRLWYVAAELGEPQSVHTAETAEEAIELFVDLWGAPRFPSRRGELSRLKSIAARKLGPVEAHARIKIEIKGEEF